MLICVTGGEVYGSMPEGDFGTVGELARDQPRGQPADSAGLLSMASTSPGVKASNRRHATS